MIAQFLASLNCLKRDADTIAEGEGLDVIMLHPKLYYELIRNGVGEATRDRSGRVIRLTYNGVDIKEGRPSLPANYRRY